MYKLPAFNDEQIEKLAREHKLFETVFGTTASKDSMRMIENLRATKRGWYCVRCGLCCCSDLIVPVITVGNTPKKNFPAIIKEAKRNPETLHVVGILESETMCPNLCGCIPLNMSCRIHTINKALKTPCASHRPFENWDMPCLYGASLIRDMDEDFDVAMQGFNKTRYLNPLTGKRKTTIE